jgi:LEA14-like dessication related protein
MNPLVLLVGGGLLIWYLQKKEQASATDALQFIISDIKGGGSFFQPELNITILAQNPTDTTIPIKSMAGEVFVNNEKVGNVSNFQPFDIAANREVPFTIKCRPSIVGIFTTIMDIIDGTAGIAASVKIAGTINVDGTIVPMQLTQNIV